MENATNIENQFTAPGKNIVFDEENCPVTATMQVFPADQETVDLLPAAAANVWWITVEETKFTYNLRRMGSNRLFTVEFDLTKPLETLPPAPWGWGN